MCVCVPAAAPFLLFLLDGLVGALWALGPLLVPLTTVLFAIVFLTARGLAAAIRWPVVEFLERRELRQWNERMALIHPHLRDRLPQPRRRIDMSVVRPEPVKPLAIEAAPPQLMPPAIHIYATPRKELQR